MGPLVSAAHRAKVAGLVDDGVAQGADLVVDGRGLRVEGHDGGFWLGPTLFDRVEPGMRVYDEEVFGPVLVVVRARHATPRRSSSSTPAPTATAPRSSRTTGAPRGPSSRT